MDDDWLTTIGVIWVVVFWSAYFYWQRRRHLAGKRVWLPLIAYPLFCLTTGIRFGGDNSSPLEECVRSRNSQRIARFLKRADDLRMRKQRPDGLLPGRSSSGSSPGDSDVTGQS